MNINRNFFENLYKHNSDPWKFASSSYELKRYQRICEIIGDQIFHHTFEAGCSIGVLTEKLAAKSRFIEAIDISPTATALARKRCYKLKNVHIYCEALENCRIHRDTDLIIFSEIGYYFQPVAWSNLIDKLVKSCNTFHLLASHWLGVSKDHILSADAVHALINENPVLQLKHSERNEKFRLDYWIKK